MKLTDFLNEVYDLFDDENKRNWPEEEVLRYGDRIVASLNRQLVETDQGYSDCNIFVPHTDLIERIQNTLDYDLPPWVCNVIEVNRASSTPTHQNPALNTMDVLIGTPVDKTNQERQPGWNYTQRNVLRLWRHTGEIDLVLLVAKRPAKMLKITLDEDALSTTEVLVPQVLASTDQGAVELEDDWYRNERFFCTATTQPDPTLHKVVGQSRVCIASEVGQAVGTKLYTKLTFSQPWGSAMKIGDVLEIQVGVPPEHTSLLTYEVARMGFIKKQSKDGLAALMPALLQARQEYRRFIQPRAVREPDFYRTTGRRRYADWQGKDPNYQEWI